MYPAHLYPARDWPREDLPGRVPWSAQGGSALVCPFSHVTFSLWKFPYFSALVTAPIAVFITLETVVQALTRHIHLPCTHVGLHTSAYSYTRTQHVYERPHTQSSLGKLPPLACCFPSYHHPPQNTETKEMGWTMPPTTCQPGRRFSLHDASSPFCRLPFPLLPFLQSRLPSAPYPSLSLPLLCALYIFPSTSATLSPLFVTLLTL